jgi:hypothetical protein
LTDQAHLPVEPLIAPGLQPAVPPAALAALALAENPSDDGTTYDLQAARTQAAAEQEQAGSGSAGAGAPPMLDIIPSADSDSLLPPDSAQKNEIPYSAPRLSGNEDADQKVCFQYFLSRKVENRSSYEVGRVFGIPTALVDRWRKKYQWDREVTAIEDNAMLDDQDEQNLHDLVGLEMMTITGLQGILGRHNAASTELEKMKNTPKPTTKEELLDWKAERSSLLAETLSPSMLINIVDNLMLLKKAKIGQRKRRPGKIFFVIDPATREKLTAEFQRRPTAPEPEEEGA